MHDELCPGCKYPIYLHGKYSLPGPNCSEGACLGCNHPVYLHSETGCDGDAADWCLCRLTPVEIALVLGNRPVDTTPKCICGDSRHCEIHVSCDNNCKALREPKTEDDFRDAYEHWKNHSVLNGCSHGC